MGSGYIHQCLSFLSLMSPSSSVLSFQGDLNTVLYIFFHRILKYSTTPTFFCHCCLIHSPTIMEYSFKNANLIFLTPSFRFPHLKVNSSANIHTLHILACLGLSSFNGMVIWRINAGWENKNKVNGILFSRLELDQKESDRKIKIR